MKSRTIAAMAIIVVLLGVGLMTTAAAASPSARVTGGIQFSAPDWGNLTIWQQYSVRQVAPDTHAAKGIVNWKIHSPTDGWRLIDARATCLAVTDQPDGSKTAVVVSQLVRVRGWGQGAPGEYARFWVRDGGTPGAAGDQWTSQSYQLEPEWIEFWPADGPAPDCESIFPDGPPFDVERGNLVIH